MTELEQPTSNGRRFRSLSSSSQGGQLFGQCQQRPAEEVSLRRLRLELALDELRNLLGDDGGHDVSLALAVGYEDSEPRMTVGSHAYLEVDAESGDFLFYDQQGAAPYACRAASEDRVFDLVLGHLLDAEPGLFETTEGVALSLLLRGSIAGEERQLLIRSLRQKNGARWLAASILDTFLRNLHAKLRSRWRSPQSATSNQERGAANVPRTWTRMDTNAR